MKAKIKTILVIAGTAIALVAASQSVNPTPQPGDEKVNGPCYSEEDVRLLMDSNQWSRQAAVEVLELSCLASDRIH